MNENIPTLIIIWWPLADVRQGKQRQVRTVGENKTSSKASGRVATNMVENIKLSLTCLTFCTSICPTSSDAGSPCHTPVSWKGTETQM